MLGGADMRSSPSPLVVMLSFVLAAQAIAEASDPPFWPEEITSQIDRAAERAGSSALVVIHRGDVVLEWGAITKRFNSHSARKSLLSALMGVAVDRGLLDIDRPVGSFDLPEGGKLNDVERSATVRELMMSRSGIYLRAANETPAGDPFSALGLDPALLPDPGDAHEDQWLDIDYYDKSGTARTFSGQESTFDWSDVSQVVAIKRDFEVVGGVEGLAGVGGVGRGSGLAGMVGR